MNIDPKAAFATFGAALSGLFWFLLSKFDVANIGTWTTEEMLTATGFTTTIVVFAFAWTFRNSASPLPEEALGIPIDGIPPEQVPTGE